MSTSADYLDLHINLEDIPDYASISPVLTKEDNATLFVGHFIKKLQQAVGNGSHQELLTLYEGDFKWAEKNYFSSTNWPEPHQLEQACDIEVNLATQSIYNELIYRSQFERADKIDDLAGLAQKSWQNYLTILQNIGLREKFSLTEAWIWDILEQFVTQFETVCEWKSKTINNLDGLGTQYWSITQMRNVLRSLYAPLIQNQRLKLSETLTSKDLLGYFGLVSHLRLETLLGKYSQVLQLVQVISLDHTIVFSRSFGSQMTLFYITAFCYFITERYTEAVKLSETIAIFFQKYKAFIKDSLREDYLAKLNEKILGLWCLANVFGGNQAHDVMLGIITDQSVVTKERNYQELLIDKYEKLSQFDDYTFLQLFNHSAPRLINQNTFTIQNHKDMANRFNHLKRINLTTILKLYSKIELVKMARFLEVEQEDLSKSLETFGKSKASASQLTPWQKTILKSLLGSEREYTVQVKDGIVHIQREAEKRDAKDYTYLLNGINDIARNLEKI